MGKISTIDEFLGTWRDAVLFEILKHFSSTAKLCIEKDRLPYLHFSKDNLEVILCAEYDYDFLHIIRIYYEKDAFGRRYYKEFVIHNHDEVAPIIDEACKYIETEEYRKLPQEWDGYERKST